MAAPNNIYGTESPKSTQGDSFKSLLQAATGKDYADIGEADVERWASSQGWRQKDVKRIVKGFTKFSKRDNDYNITAPGEFQVVGASGSGRRKGNVKGFDVGDVIGLGRDVSLLGGALETIQTGSGEKAVSPMAGTLQTSGTEVNLEGVELPDYNKAFNLNAATPSGQGATQVAVQNNQDRQKAQSPKQTIIDEGPGDIAFSPSQVFDRSPFLQRQGLGLLNTDPNDFGGNVRLSDNLKPIEGKVSPEDVTSLSEASVEEAKQDEEGFFDRLSNLFGRTNVESTTVGEIRPLVETFDRVFGTDVSDTAVGEFIAGSALLPTGSAKPIGQAIVKGLKASGKFTKSVGEGLKSITKKGWKNIRVPNWNEQQAVKAVKELIKQEKNLLPRQAESLKNVITTPPPATRVGNIGFRPKVNRFGGKLKFSR